MDMLSFSPGYDYTTYLSMFVVISSNASVSILLLSIAVIMKECIMQQPKLVKQGSGPLPVEANVNCLFRSHFQKEWSRELNTFADTRIV